MEGKELTDYYYAGAWKLYGSLKVAHDAHERGRILKDHDDRIRAEARAKLARKIVDWPIKWHTAPDADEANAYYEIIEYCAAILADEPKDKCRHCNGNGYTAEHDPSPGSHDGLGNCLGNCPVQVQCEYCNGTGFADEPKEREAGNEYYIKRGDILVDLNSQKVIEYDGTEDGIPRYGFVVLMRRAEVERKLKEAEHGD